MATLRQWAQRYLELGYHPIPVKPKSKIPAVNWKPYQSDAPTAEEWDQWARQWPDANIALVLGRGRFAVDLDGGADAEALLSDAGIALPNDAPRSKTANGYHVLLAGDVGDRVGLLSNDGGKPQVDIRGIGIIVAPPSIHPSGARYEWEIPPKADRPLPSAPAPLLSLIAAAAPAPVSRATSEPEPGESWVDTALRGVGEGQRDAVCTRLAGFLLGKGLDADIVARLLIDSFGARCTPPFPEADVRKCVASVARRERLDDDRAVIHPRHISAVLSDMDTERRAGRPHLVPTPFHGLNYYLSGGFMPGELIYLGARPGVGKTAMALHVASHAARHGHGVVCISREMVDTALGRRLMAQTARLDSNALRSDELDQSSLERYDHAMTQMAGLPLWITDKVVSLPQIQHVIEHAEEWAFGQRIGLVVIDYLQLIRAPRDVKERRLQVEAVSSGLKTLATHYHLPVLCLSSLTRPPGQDEDRRPTLAMLRESGELEHDADIVLFLHRTNKVTRDTELIVEKNREGALGTVHLAFTPQHLTFDAVTTADMH